MAGDGAPGQAKPLGDLFAGHPVLAAQAGDHGEPGQAFLWAFIRMVPRQLAMVAPNHLPGFSPDEQPA
jgi:hypothetical protein